MKLTRINDMALAADSKSLYIPISTIYGKPNADGTYTLNALDVKNLNDNLYAIAKKVQGGLTTSDLTSAAIDELHAGTVISNTVITNELYSSYGSISDLVVNKLRTDYAKAIKFLNSDTSDINYINIHDETISFITATVGSGTEQLTNGDRVFYWTDETHTQMTSEKTTDYPVMIYKYSELEKARIAFEEIALSGSNKTVMPVLTLGAGNGNGENAKGKIYKTESALIFAYTDSNGYLKNIRMDDDGIQAYINSTDGMPHLIDFTPAGLDIVADSAGGMNISGSKVSCANAEITAPAFTTGVSASYPASRIDRGSISLTSTDNKSLTSDISTYGARIMSNCYTQITSGSGDIWIATNEDHTVGIQTGSGWGNVEIGNDSGTVNLIGNVLVNGVPLKTS